MLKRRGFGIFILLLLGLSVPFSNINASENYIHRGVKFQVNNDSRNICHFFAKNHDDQPSLCLDHNQEDIIFDEDAYISCKNKHDCQEVILSYRDSLEQEIQSLDHNKRRVNREIKTIFKETEVAHSTKSMVVSSHPIATKIGKEILDRGGNAVDAAIAVQFALNVVEPYSSGIGGGGFLVYYDAKEKKSYLYDARNTAPGSSNRRMFLDKKGKAREFKDIVRGGLSVSVPGALKLMDELHDERGELPWKRLIDPIIHLAKHGYHQDIRGYNLAVANRDIMIFPQTRNLFYSWDRGAKKVKEKIINLEFAESLELIAKQRSKVFYSGEIGRNIVKAVNQTSVNKGHMTMMDLQKYRIKKPPIIDFTYRNYRIVAPYPPSSALTILQALGMLEQFNLQKLQGKDQYSQAVPLLAQALRLAYADRAKYIADPDFVYVPVKGMLNKKYLKQRSNLILKNKVNNNIQPGEPMFFQRSENINKNIEIAINNLDPKGGLVYDNPSTTHISVIDNEGNVVSWTSSIEYTYGSGLMVNGFLLNNEMTDFSLISETRDHKKVANSIAPMKRARSSMSPMIVFDPEGNVKLIIGSPGGYNIIAYVLKLLVAIIDWDYDVNIAVKLPNFNVKGTNLSIEKDSFLDEEEIIKSYGNQGFAVHVKDLTSGLNAIKIDYVNEQAIYHGFADPRRAGTALGQ